MNKTRWWKISNFISLLFSFLIGLMWLYTAKKYNPNINRLTNRDEVNKYLSKNFSDSPQKLIPTGVFIQSLKFTSSSEVNFTGYVWQIYPQSQYKGIPDEEIPVGFILPEAVDSGNNIAPTFAYREQINGDKEVIGWYFEETLKQAFDYLKYPFDYKTVWIRFWSSDFMGTTILVPDFDAYKFHGLKDAFGYDENIILGNWELKGTFFDYRKQNYNTNFGIHEKGYHNNRPELYFNIKIERRFLNSFIVFILPLLIIACLAFSTLMMTVKDPEQASKFGINTSGVIGVCSGLFFVILLSQVQIRKQFAGTRIVYVEFFYPLMYVTLLAVSVNSYLLSRTHKEDIPCLKWVDYEDNIIPKLIYWPVLLGSATIITAVVLLPKYEGSTLKKRQDLSFLQDKQLSDQTTFLSFNFDLDAINNSTKPTYQTLLPMPLFQVR